MLEQIRGNRHACDLDLLLFFCRHPRALLTSEQIVAHVGYAREQVAKSLDGLIEAGLVSRSQSPAHAARLHVLEPEGGVLSSFLRIATTREGRLEVLRLLRGDTDGAPVTRLRRRAPLSKVA
jgi:hypothetical protein